MPEKSDLSERELEILNLVATGASNKEIAQQLVISTNTVKVHLKNIFNKIGAASRTEAAMYAVSTGIIEGGNSNGVQISSELAGEEIPSTVGDSFYKTLNWPLIGLGLILVIIVISISAFFINRSLRNQPTDEQVILSSDWKEMKSLPTARFGLATAVYETYIFALSGVDSQGVTGIVERYDPTTDTWVSVRDKPVPVSDVSGTVIGGKIYIPGGQLSSGAVSNVLEIYDPQQDEWSRGGNLPVPISAYGLTSFEGKLYLFGGWDGEQFLDTVYEYSPDTDQWKSISVMPTSRANPGVTVVGSKIFIIGGLNGEGVTGVNEVFVPDLANAESDPWEIHNPLPEGGYAMGTTSVADTIYLVGGINQDGGQSSSLVFNPFTGEWRSLADPPADFGSYLGLESIGTTIFGVGGKNNEVPQDKNLAYQAMYTISIPLITK